MGNGLSGVHVLRNTLILLMIVVVRYLRRPLTIIPYNLLVCPESSESRNPGILDSSDCPSRADLATSRVGL